MEKIAVYTGKVS